MTSPSTPLDLRRTPRKCLERSLSPVLCHVSSPALKPAHAQRTPALRRLHIRPLHPSRNPNLCAWGLWQTFFFFNDAASVKTDSKKSQKGRRRKRKKCGSRPRAKGRKEKKTTTRLSPVSCASLSVFFFFTYLYFVRGATTTQCETRDASLFRPTKSRWVSEMPRQRTLPRQRSVHCVVLWHVGVHFLFVMFL